MEIEKEMSTTPAYKNMSNVFHRYRYKKGSDLECISSKLYGKYKDFMNVVEHDGYKALAFVAFL